MCQTADGLIDHGLHDGGGNVLARAALVQQRQDVGFGEHAAAGGNGVNRAVAQGQRVQSGRIRTDEGAHLVDEGPGAASAGFVHALFQPAGEEGDFGVFPAQFNDDIGVGNLLADGQVGGQHLLNERQAKFAGQRETAGTGDAHAGRSAVHEIRNLFQNPGGAGPHCGIVPGIFAEHDRLGVVQHHGLDRGGADIKTNVKMRLRHGYCCIFLLMAS